MKLLAAILVFMIAAQPVQAGFCDMQPSGGSAAHAGMQHDGMQHDKQSEPPPAHDCCAPTGADGSGNCDNMVQCGACVAAVAVVSAVPAIGSVPDLAFRSFLNDSDVPPSHASPPYRPPIFIS
jgi:hypothetical protein